MSWRSVIVARSSSLSLNNGSLIVKQGFESARVPLEDIATIVLDHVQINITAQLLAACSEMGISVLTTNETHLPNGMLLPFLSHSRALKIMRTQLDMGVPLKKQLWQALVKQKILNQATVLEWQQLKAHSRLTALASEVKSGDINHCESQAAHIYFRALFGPDFNRNESRFWNGCLNYGYAIVRSAIARHLVAYGFLPAFGIFHHNEQNAFNLADDIIEPYRALVDAHVLQQFPTENQNSLSPHDKAYLVSILHRDLEFTRPNKGQFSLQAALEETIQSLGRIVRKEQNIKDLMLPSAQHFLYPPAKKEEDL